MPHDVSLKADAVLVLKEHRPALFKPWVLIYQQVMKSVQ